MTSSLGTVNCHSFLRAPRSLELSHANCARIAVVHLLLLVPFSSENKASLYSSFWLSYSNEFWLQLKSYYYWPLSITTSLHITQIVSLLSCGFPCNYIIISLTNLCLCYVCFNQLLFSCNHLNITFSLCKIEKSYVHLLIFRIPFDDGCHMFVIQFNVIPHLGTDHFGISHLE